MNGRQPHEPNDVRADWRLTVIAGVVMSAILGVAAIVNALGFSHRPFPLALRLAHMLCACVVTAFVWSRRSSPSRALCAIAFTILVLPLLATTWMVDTALATSHIQGRAFSPFMGHVLAAFFTAALCPRPRWLAPALILTFAAHAVAIWTHLDLGSDGARIPEEEPILSIAFLAVALTLYGHRVYHERHERELVHARAEVAMLRTINEAFLAVKDMANTPLQTLEIGLALMRSERGASDRLLASASRAVRRLSELNQLLPVTEVPSASVDHTVLDQLRRTMSRASGTASTPPSPGRISRLRTWWRSTRALSSRPELRR